MMIVIVEVEQDVEEQIPWRWLIQPSPGSQKDNATLSCSLHSPLSTPCSIAISLSLPPSPAHWLPLSSGRSPLPFCFPACNPAHQPPAARWAIGIKLMLIPPIRQTAQAAKEQPGLKIAASAATEQHCQNAYCNQCSSEIIPAESFTVSFTHR